MTMNRLIAQAIAYTHHDEHMIGIDRPNTVCQFRYYRSREEDSATYIVYLYRGVPVAFALNNFIVDFGLAMGQTKRTYRRYLPMLKERGRVRIIDKYTLDRDFHISRREFKS